jgi:hypothetical protein
VSTNNLFLNDRSIYRLRSSTQFHRPARNEHRPWTASQSCTWSDKIRLPSLVPQDQRVECPPAPGVSADHELLDRLNSILRHAPQTRAWYIDASQSTRGQRGSGGELNEGRLSVSRNSPSTMVSSGSAAGGAPRSNDISRKGAKLASRDVDTNVHAAPWRRAPRKFIN